MSFALDLDFSARDRREAERVVATTASPDLIPVVVGRRGLRFDPEQADAVLDDAAHWDEGAFTLSADGRRRLAATVRALSHAIEPGWGLRAHWVGDPLDREQEITAGDLADLIERSQLDRRTLYRVR
jgi:hypothetical protein